MKTKTIRILIPLAVLLAAGVGFVLHTGLGNLSAIGWGDIALLCPLGALGTMLATKTLVPKALISLAIAAIAIVVLGRAFCAWVCPVPVVSKLRGIFSKRPADGAEALEPGNECSPAVLTDDERAALKRAAGSCGSAQDACAKKGCASCADVRAKLDSRHLILGGSLLSAAVFGFPVFCLICPIGLSFATVFLIILLFSGGDVTWSLVAVPALLVVEVVLLRKWCAKICPLSALMSLVAKANRTFKPAIDDAACLETGHGAACGRCALACEQAINPRHPELGARWSECTKCRACVDACPTSAISLPFLPAKGATAPQGARVQEAADRADDEAAAQG